MEDANVIPFTELKEPNLCIVEKAEYNEDTGEYDFLEYKVDLWWDIPVPKGKEIPVSNGVAVAAMTMTIDEAKIFVERLQKSLYTQLERI